MQVVSSRQTAAALFVVIIRKLQENGEPCSL